MIGSSSTWYATSARLRTSRSSAARAADVVLEDAKQLLRGVDDRIGVLRLQARTVVYTAPRHRDREHARRLRGADVERRVADVGRLCRVGAESLRREQERLRVGLVA